MNFQRILFFSLLIISSFSVFAQRNGVKYGVGKGGYSEQVNRGKNGFIRLVKEVWFDIEEKNTYITGDSALYYDKQGIMIVYGDVVIKEGDSVTITARELHYLMQDNKAELRRNVVYKDGSIILTTDYLDYFTNTEDARFYNGGKIVDGETTLKAKDAFVVNAENLIKFYNKVDLNSPEYNLKTDTLFYDRITKIATTYGPTQTIMEDGETVDAKEGGKFYTVSKKVRYQEGKITTESYEIFGDNLFFDEIKNESQADGRVKVISEEKNIIILGDIAVSKQETGVTKVWGNPVLKQMIENDTIYITADTLISIDSDIDSLSRLLAYKNVKIYKSDLQGIADSMAYNLTDSVIHFYQKPVLWSDDNQITGDTISISIINGTMDKMNINSHAFTANIDTAGNYNQIKGRDMIAYLKNDQMDRIYVYGNGEAIYFALDDEDYSLIGMNKIQCAEMKLIFIDGSMNDITFYKNPEGKFIPPHELAEPEKRLKDFNWQIEKKPSLADVLGKWTRLGEVKNLEIEKTPEKSLGNEKKEAKTLLEK
ncbi:MAG: lipopolysaccharide export system protein LptA [Marivirga sp.]|jgi:lipopolysaccharide export system protein LptA